MCVCVCVCLCAGLVWVCGRGSGRGVGRGAWERRWWRVWVCGMGGGDTRHQGFSAVDLARDFNYPELADYIRGKLPGITESAAAAPGTEKAH